ncbi:hypothetical protein IT893_10155 [Thalassospira sp. A40-3]|uniref:hypothetical protein n=1 Tax=Thalassospira sp. A40-3 TaxID=2785908 RepID=UPI0018CD8C9B|nr:hypothetical protein [Thalassospira sp. A40-3]QPO10165.1 hypothetical protein IT893_10155 [Thalassospira sp. A40-3]
MDNNVKAFIIALGLVILFFVGAMAGYSTGHSEFWNVTGDTGWRLQWEVLLTGLAAIFGGYMAYRGATEPSRVTSKQIAERHLSEFKDAFITLRMLANKNGPYYKFLRLDPSDPRVKARLRQEMLSTAARIPILPLQVFTERAAEHRMFLDGMEKTVEAADPDDLLSLAELACNIADSYIEEIKKHAKL